MTDEQTRNERAKRMLMKELRSPKYRQRVEKQRKKYKRQEKYKTYTTEEE
jgi:stalled ribosome alternative rescue factor ArfA